MMGLGQGLMGAGKVVGQSFAEAEEQGNKDRAFDEQTRQFDLAQELAEKAQRDRNNQAGVEDLYRQGQQMQQEKEFAANESFRKNSEQLKMMDSDADRMFQREQLAQNGLRDAALAGYYKQMGNAANTKAGNATQDKFIDEGRVIQAINSERGSLKELMDQIANPLNGMDTERLSALQQEASAVRTRLGMYQKKLDESLLGGGGAVNPDLSKAALDMSGWSSPTAPAPGGASLLPKRQPNDPFRQQGGL